MSFVDEKVILPMQEKYSTMWQQARAAREDCMQIHNLHANLLEGNYIASRIMVMGQ